MHSLFFSLLHLVLSLSFSLSLSLLRSFSGSLVLPHVGLSLFLTYYIIVSVCIARVPSRSFTPKHRIRVVFKSVRFSRCLLCIRVYMYIYILGRVTTPRAFTVYAFIYLHTCTLVYRCKIQSTMLFSNLKPYISLL